MRRVLRTVAASFLLLSVAAAASPDTTVYVTRTGSKYHKGGCRYLSKSKIPMALKDAKKAYDPCSVCRPPTSRGLPEAA
jgi:hypothetical protein